MENNSVEEFINAECSNASALIDKTLMAIKDDWNSRYTAKEVGILYTTFQNRLAQTLAAMHLMMIVQPEQQITYLNSFCMNAKMICEDMKKLNKGKVN
jgi:hypothetical protein